MRRQTFAMVAGLLAAWAVFAGWQYHSYRRECALISETVHQQAHTVMNALVGGIQSHRRLGHFFAIQLQGMLEELAQSQDVLAVSILSEDGERMMRAGDVTLLQGSLVSEPGDYWDTAGFRLVKDLHINPPDTGGSAAGQTGGGRGGYRWREEDPAFDAFRRGGDFIATLLLDRARSDTLRRRAGWTHILTSTTAALVLVCLAFAWIASVRLTEARGRARVLEIEARHYRELSQAAAGLAHETRNPLGLIRGWTQRLYQTHGDATDREGHASAVIEECDRLTARINQFLTYARPPQPSLAQVDLAQLVDEVQTILQPDLEVRDLQFAKEVPQATSTLWADREMLRQALFNLVQNAIQFSPEGATVSVVVIAQRDGWCRIEVRDRGPGVPLEAADALFTPYFTTRPNGTGLGLAIVRRIAAAHHWRSTYHARSGGGAIFGLEMIPCHPNEQPSL